MVTAPDGGRRSTRGCSIASLRDEPFSNTCGPASEHRRVICDRSLASTSTMTPLETSTHRDKIVVPTIEQSSNQSSASEQNGDQSSSSDPASESEPTTDSKPASDSGSHSERPASDRGSRLLPHSEGVYHLSDDDGNPLCRAAGTFATVSVSEAREKTRLCRNCRTLQEGHVGTRPCPRCGRPIRLTRWPQHFRACRGQPTDASDEDP